MDSFGSDHRSPPGKYLLLGGRLVITHPLLDISQVESDIQNPTIVKPRPNALDFSLYIARQMSSIAECCREGVAKRSRLSLDLELNIPRMYYSMNNSYMECFVHYLMNCNCTCVRSTTLDNFALDQTSLDKTQSSQLHSTRWPNALDVSLNMHVERCIVKSRERLARAL